MTSAGHCNAPQSCKHCPSTSYTICYTNSKTVSSSKLGRPQCLVTSQTYPYSIGVILQLCNNLPTSYQGPGDHKNSYLHERQFGSVIIFQRITELSRLSLVNCKIWPFSMMAASLTLYRTWLKCICYPKFFLPKLKYKAHSLVILLSRTPELLSPNCN